jgi:DNA-binding transcriptional regulator PaaX
MKTVKKMMAKQSRKLDSQELPIPGDDRIAALSRLLAEQYRKEESRRHYAPVKQVLKIIGIAGVLGVSIFSPGGARLGKDILRVLTEREREDWRRYNPHYLRRTLGRLKQQKLVEITEENGEEVVMLTKGGKRRILRYALDELSIPKPKQWDGRWRMVIYDVDERKKKLRDVFRLTLRSLGFFKLQESVWVYPYPCEEQVTFLREYYGVGNEVLYVVATTLEDDAPYRAYFGLT